VLGEVRRGAEDCGTENGRRHPDGTSAYTEIGDPEFEHLFQAATISSPSPINTPPEGSGTVGA